MSNHEQFHFLTFDPHRNTKKDREVQDSRARAHAAHIAHVRRRTKTPFVLSVPKGTKHKSQDEQTKRDETVDEGQSRPRKSTKPLASTKLKPLNSLQKGNSDPFNAYAIPLTAERNEVIAFYNTNVLPLFTNYMEASGILANVGRATWHDPYSDIRDEVNAYGLLSRTAAIMKRTPEASKRMTIQSSTYKGKLLRLLRASILPGEMPNVTQEVYQCVISLLITAVFEGALDEAATHLSILRSFLYMQSETSEVNPGVLFTVLWYDFQRAAKSLTRPVFDFKGWAERQFRPDWSKAQVDIPVLSGEAEAGLNPGFGSTGLREVFRNLRELREILCALEGCRRKLDPTTPVAVAQRALIFQGQIIDGYVDAIQREQQTTEGQDWTPSTQAYICLAALWWTRRLVKEENPPTKVASTVLNASETILPALQMALIKAETDSQDTKGRYGSQARLWALYVGTIAERQHFTRTTSIRDGDWFTSRFVFQAKGLGLRTWADVQRVLEAFLYSDRVEVSLSQTVMESVNHDAT